jgi:2',3'-cyclic-nucleotide 2'-phosphodiesterase (5'-nucleotidase family)
VEGTAPLPPHRHEARRPFDGEPRSRLSKSCIDKGKLAYKTADFHIPWNIGVTPDPNIQTQLNKLNMELGPILGGTIGQATRIIPRADACGQPAGRTCESLEGNLVADAMRLTYGTDFALTNSGGVRADLTCPTADNPSDLCPAYTPPPYPITRGQTLSVLPFGNVAVTLTLDGGRVEDDARKRRVAHARG